MKLERIRPSKQAGDEIKKRNKSSPAKTLNLTSLEHMHAVAWSIIISCNIDVRRVILSGRNIGRVANFLNFSVNMFLIVLVQLTFLKLLIICYCYCWLSGSPNHWLIAGMNDVDDEATLTSSTTSNYIDNLKDYCRKLRSNRRFVSFGHQLDGPTTKKINQSKPLLIGRMHRSYRWNPEASRKNKRVKCRHNFVWFRFKEMRLVVFSSSHD